MLQKTNEPIRVAGVTEDGKKVYTGDTTPIYPNRKMRRSFKQAKLKNNSKPTEGTNHKLVYRYIRISDAVKLVIKQVKTIFLKNK
jgi:hypothetical protein